MNLSGMKSENANLKIKIKTRKGDDAYGGVKGLKNMLCCYLFRSK